ncbi:putative target of rapamycin (TOR) kinase 1 [Trypanosoma cruzi]|uniref:Putative target of rapamycin (TOR) kinase 1 n=1 Tax=Trypanosoma cruzi TaxID=5693 RepID=A0A2V2WV74_TRYCR|nr:putative target of rapamycin (TOR) kinase 1 [Trypanosoma cruzi]
MQAEARALRLALSAFPAVLPSTMDVWVDNTSLQGAANKGSSKSNAMAWELRRIYEFLDSHRLQASVAYVRCAENPRRRHITRLCFYASGRGEGVELAKGSGGVFWLEDPKVCHFSINIYISNPSGVSGPQLWLMDDVYIHTFTWCKVWGCGEPTLIPFTSHFRLVCFL